MDDKRFIEAADCIWDKPETGLDEYNTQKVQCELFEEVDFVIEKGLSQLETSYEATWGSGSPTIGFLAEMDALEGLSQKADLNVCKPDPNMTAGQCCGHQLLGVGAIAAAVKYKEYLEINK